MGIACYDECLENIKKYEHNWLKENHTYYSSRFSSGEHPELCEMFENLKNDYWLPCQWWCNETHIPEGNL